MYLRTRRAIDPSGVGGDFALDEGEGVCLGEFMASLSAWPSCVWGGGKTKKILMKNIGLKLLITNRIIWNSKQTKNKKQ